VADAIDRTVADAEQAFGFKLDSTSAPNGQGSR